MDQLKKSIWLTWEHQRRSIELSQHFGVDFFEITSDAHKIIKKFIMILKTVKILNKTRPKTVFVQNPSNILAALICFLSIFYKFTVVVDRHSNFIFSESDAEEYSRLSVLIGNILSAYSLARADLTIVTNKYIENIVLDHGGKAFILPDKIPVMTKGADIKLKGKYNVVFPCTFSPDEPVEEVIKAAALLDKDIVIYITGKFSKFKKLQEMYVPKNVVFTGYLTEEEYQSYLNSCTIVLTLTKREHTLLCSAYEAVSLNKPFVLSDKEDLREYFRKGNVPTDNSSEGIAASINQCIKDHENLVRSVNELRKELSSAWDIKFETLLQQVADISGGKRL